MKSQFIEVKIVLEIMTEEEISYTEAESRAVEEVRILMKNKSEHINVVDIIT